MNKTKPLFLEENLDLSLREFMQLMQDRIVKDKSSYFGVHTLKNPLDLWVYQEILFEKQPDVLVEIGNYHGGSALVFAHMFDQLGKGRLIAVDRDQARVDQQARKHPRITWIESDGVAAYDQVVEQIADDEVVMVMEDSSHSFENTLSVLRTYGSLVTSGQYFIVEDTVCNHGLDWGPSPGAYEAVEAFDAESDQFSIDRARESFFVTWNPKGFLLKA